MKRFILFVALLALLGTGAAQTLAYGLSGLPASMDAADSQDGNSLTVSASVTETLVGFVPGSTELAPKLATAWEPNDDATSWTFELREGVTFHDGTPFDADAVKFNFDRWNIVDHPYGFRDQGKNYVPFEWVFGAPASEGGILDSVHVVDTHTVRFDMTQPTPFLPSLLAAVYFQMNSPAAVMEAGADYGTPGVGSVGTGPFVFDEWREGQQIRVDRNDDYWNGPAQVETVVFRGIAESTSRLAELQAGSIDIAVDLAPDEFSSVASNPDLTAEIADSDLNVGYLAMHQANEPFDDLRVRQAIAHAIDREAIVDAFYGGLAVTAEDHIPPGFFGHGMDWPYDYDPERAMELLAEAGYAGGFETELWYMPVSRPYYPSPQPIAEAMASYLADVGITAELLTEDWTTYLSDYNTGAFPMYMLGWYGDIPDPDNFLNTFFGGTAPDEFGWDAPEVREALNEARQIVDLDQRAELYAQVNDAVARQAVSIPMGHNRTLNAVRAGIDGYVASPLGYSAVSLHSVTKN
ncbi:MAG: ABC transporter substrate-binding protein [Trueperaceae bacterium]|nr:ABC transporter substrate-binding protein [Trueperaceae bacterium]